MTVEAIGYIGDLNKDWPLLDDPRGEGDDHIRRIKENLVRTLPNFKGAVTKTHDQINATPHNQAGVISLLGFTPVERGTGAGQQADTPVRIGWNGTKLTANIGAANVDLGAFTFASEFTGGNQSINSNNAGFQKLPGGLIVQWGHLTNLSVADAAGSTGEAILTFPLVFPSGTAPIVWATNSTGDGNEGLEISVANVLATASNCTLRFMRIRGTGGGAGEKFAVSILAIGR